MISKNLSKFYINGAWVAPLGGTMMGVENPANEEIVAEVALGSAADADRAIGAARDAFLSYTTTPVADRIALLKRILEVYNSREDDFVEAMKLQPIHVYLKIGIIPCPTLRFLDNRMMLWLIDKICLMLRYCILRYKIDSNGALVYNSELNVVKPIL
jgi:hypothetical protein